MCRRSFTYRALPTFWPGDFQTLHGIISGLGPAKFTYALSETLLASKCDQPLKKRRKKCVRVLSIFFFLKEHPATGYNDKNASFNNNMLNNIKLATKRWHKNKILPQRYYKLSAEGLDRTHVNILHFYSKFSNFVVLRTLQNAQFLNFVVLRPCCYF